MVYSWSWKGEHGVQERVAGLRKVSMVYKRE
jgi:hypothetical protein